MSETFYKRLFNDADIEQGDIFSTLPFLSLDSTSITEVIADSDLKYKQIDLNSYVQDDSEKNIVVSAKIGPGIIITQNCDMLRSSYVSYCAIRKYEEVEKSFPSPEKVKKRVDFLTKEYAHKTKYFYLPVENPHGFSERMAVDFSTIHQVKLEVLKGLASKRMGRLSEVPLEHFRSKLGHYFKRFAYDPWYVLNKDELDIYKQSIEPLELQLVRSYGWHE